MKVKSIKHNFIMNCILILSNLLFPLITFPYIARVLLADGLGRVTLVSSISEYFLMVASLGIPTYGIRVTAKLRDDKEALSKAVWELFVINGIMTVITISAYIAMVLLVPGLKENRGLFFVFTMFIALNMFGVNWLYKGLEQYDYITIRSVIFKLISLIMILVFVKTTKDYLIYGAILVFAAVGSHILNFIRMHRYVYFKRYKHLELKKHMKPILVLFAQTLSTSIYLNLDIIMMGILTNTTEVGYYNAALKVKGVLVGVVTSLSTVLLPRMSYYLANKEEQKFERVTALALNAVLILAIPLAVYFSVFSPEYMIILAGKEFSSAIIGMRIITFSIIPIGVTNVLGLQVLTAQEKENYVLYSVATGAVVDFVLNLILIPLYGVSGATTATLITEVVVLFMQLLYTKELLSKCKKQIHFLLYLIGSGLCVAISYVSVMKLQGIWLRAMVSAVVFFGIYAIVFLLYIKKNKEWSKEGIVND